MLIYLSAEFTIKLEKNNRKRETERNRKYNILAGKVRKKVSESALFGKTREVLSIGEAAAVDAVVS
jgi:hypothetical protein